MAESKRAFPDDLTVDLFACFSVKDRAPAMAWYERFFGQPPAFLPNDSEAVWEVAEHRYLYIKVSPEHAGHASSLMFVSDLDRVVAQIAGRGVQPATRETLDNGVRKAIYRDPDGNEMAFGGAPRAP